MSKPVVAFFGATGGCTLNALVLALKNGYTSIAFVRTPSKLEKLLTEAPHALSRAVLDEHLHIVAGSTDSVAAIKTVFDHKPSVIISGVGAAPKVQYSLLNPVVMDQPDICANTARNLVQALQELDTEHKLTTKPFLVTIGSTGMSQTRDVPLLFMPLYHILLRTPHADKNRMETTVVETARHAPSVLAGYSLVRPSLLLDGPALGLDSVRTGWEHHQLDPRETGPGPAVGYTIRRADVGLWIYENYVHCEAGQWNARCVTLTY